SLATYSLVGLGRDKRAVWAAYQYLVMGTIGATFILIGIGLMYIMTGTLNMQDLAQRLPAHESSITVMSSFAFLVVGISLKLAMFPLHFWLPNAYTFAPSIVTAFLAATATKVALYLLIRFTYTVYGGDWSLTHIPLTDIFLALGLVAVFSASLVALYQSNLKRLLAFSSVAQIGYMIVGLGLATVAGLQASLLHLFNHALMKGALFMALATVIWRIGSADIANFRGIARHMPWTMAAVVVGGLSLIGVPLTAGFISKWYLVMAAIEAGYWWVAALILLGSLLAFLYIWRIVEAAYFQEAENSHPASGLRLEAPLMLLIPTWILVLANLYFGLDTRLPLLLTELAATMLSGGSL
ncbi:MAG: proton-conducting transporter membrane subunit, partial [Natronospirillum sp.]